MMELSCEQQTQMWMLFLCLFHPALETNNFERKIWKW